MTDQNDFHIRECVQVLKHFPSKKDVLEAFNLLKETSKGNNDNKEKIGISGASAILLRLLSHSDIEIQREAVRLLRSISVNERAQLQISLDGAIPILINLLSNTDDFSLNLGASAILWNLSVNDDNKRKIISGGGVPLLIDLIRTGDCKLQNEAVGCMRNLSMDEENQNVLGKLNVIHYLAPLLRSPEEKTQRNAALTLRNLASRCEKNLQRLEREPNAVKDLIKLLAEYNLDSSKGIVDRTPKLKSAEIKPTLDFHSLSPLTKKIGEGRYGDVYKASYAGFPVACKIIKKDLTDEKDTELIVTEIKIMELVKHPNIVLLMGICCDLHQKAILVTEYCENGNLKDVLPTVKDLIQRLRMGSDVAKGLAWLHAHHIIHRDLKLANLLVALDGSVKVADFGLSFEYHEGTTCKGFKGNVKYSPPEILLARSEKKITNFVYSEKTDTYAFGLMLWEIISIETLFPGIKGKEGTPTLLFTSHRVELIEQVLDGLRPPLKDTWPESLKDLLTSCWHSDPRKRPYFPKILSKYQNVAIDLLCPYNEGRKLIQQLWPNDVLEKGHKITFQEFDKKFEQSSKNASLKRADIRCLQALLCNPVDDTIELGQFCKACCWFGPIVPVNEFVDRIKEVLTYPGFHGHLSQSKGSQIINEASKISREKHHNLFLYRFSNSDLGGFVLSFIDKKGELHHQKFQRTKEGSLVCGEAKLEFQTFSRLHKGFQKIYKLKKYVPGVQYAPLSAKK